MRATPVLYLLRHADAEPAGPGGDHGRALSPDGRRAARAVGELLERMNETPDRVLVSSALRARETAALAREAGGWRAEEATSDALYSATVESVLWMLRAQEGTVSRILLVGHQPTLGMLVATLTGGEPAFPPAALARIDLDALRWSEIAPGKGRLAWLSTPELAREPRSGT